MDTYGANFPFLWVQLCAPWPCLRNKKGVCMKAGTIHVLLSQWDNLLTVQKDTRFNAQLASAITNGQCCHSVLSLLHQLIMCTYLDLIIERCIFMFGLSMVYLYTKSSPICSRSHVLWLMVWSPDSNIVSAQIHVGRVWPDTMSLSGYDLYSSRA